MRENLLWMQWVGDKRSRTKSELGLMMDSIEGMALIAFLTSETAMDWLVYAMSGWVFISIGIFCVWSYPAFVDSLSL